ncbi:hypothetical protein GOODEAATRI_002153 [Goodea atripinnis]|uniref:Secreted protein n=1 Tax=Goodea atripinnis TaxID=208336 RepID=A0ABV0NR59_9TELE
MQNRNAESFTSMIVFLHFQVCVGSCLRHFCPMRATMVTHMALFTSYSPVAMYNVKANRTKRKIFFFWSESNKRIKEPSCCEYTLKHAGHWPLQANFGQHWSK